MQKGPLVYEQDYTESDSQDYLTLLQSIQSGKDEKAIALLDSKPYLTGMVLDSGMTPLLAAVCLSRPCSMAVFRKLIDNPYTDLNVPNNLGYTAVHFMAEHNHHELLQVLLSSKGSQVDLNVQTKANIPNQDTSFTALYIASEKNHDQALRILLFYRANPNLQTRIQKRTPLHMACLNGHANNVFSLLYFGAKTDLCDSLNASAVHYLAASKQATPETMSDIGKMLTDAGADFKTTVFGFKPEDLARFSGRTDALVFSTEVRNASIPSLKQLCLRQVPDNVLPPFLLEEKYRFKQA